jgi:hypothetical protein
VQEHKQKKKHKGRVVLEKLTVAQLVKKSLAFYVTEVSLSCSQQPANGPPPDADASSSHYPTLFP